MRAGDFRRLALELPEAEEGAHHGHADFRVGGKVFATIGPDETWAMVKLTPDDQRDVVSSWSEVFEPVPGAWGKQGCTRVQLKAARAAMLRPALRAAWRRTAPAKVRARYEAK